MARHGHVRRRHARSAVARRVGRRDGRGPVPDGGGLRVLHQARRPVLLLPRPRRRAGGEALHRLQVQSRCARRRRRRLPGAHGRQAPVGDREPVHAPALPGRCGDEPGSGGVRLRRRPGQAHARCDAAARRAELRAVGRARGLRHAAQHGPAPRGCAARPLPPPRRRAQAPDRVHRPAADRAEADGADQAPVRLRRGDRPRLPRAQRPRRRVPDEHRGEPRHAGRPQLPP